MANDIQAGGAEWLVDPDDDQLAPFYTDPDSGKKKRAVWAPLPGSQEALIQATSIFEVLHEGNRGGGKTDTMIMNFGQFIGRGWGSEWKGILFRQSYKELEDVRGKCLTWFPKIWPQATFNVQKDIWRWPTGETLLFRHLQGEEDYRLYHGHNYPCVMFEELTTWPTPDLYLAMMSVCRSARMGMPKMYRATTNPYGPGHAWVKKRFQLPMEKGEIVGPLLKEIDPETKRELTRMAIHSHFDENLVLKRADPDYFMKLRPRNAAQLAAWKHGDWNVTAGGMIDDVWDPEEHVVRAFRIPDTWRIDRSFDWGSSKPFSVLWWAESDGSPIRLANGKTMHTVRGDLFLVREWYGSTGEPNVGLRWLAKDIAQGIVEREVLWGWRQPGLKRKECRVKDGPADASIFNVENGNCIADDMDEKVTLKNGCVYRGITWDPADKRPGSRKQGWEAIRQALKNALSYEQDPETNLKTPRRREFPGMFIVGEHCPEWLDHVPALPRDKKDPDDVDTEAEDHDADATRYRVRQQGTHESQGKVRGGTH